MPRFLVVIEKTKRNFSAYCPDLPGCIATGKTRTTVEYNIVEAISFHLEGLAAERKPIPRSVSEAEYVLLPPGDSLRNSAHSGA
ncbi:MAG: type II toxin-antitoxin system HicB family antitoxin [Elusimicrobiota bacterium]|nr:type II toxin-antitoxin system HicB family antitoxin [Elusimicrobiota bacterium]